MKKKQGKEGIQTPDHAANNQGHGRVETQDGGGWPGEDKEEKETYLRHMRSKRSPWNGDVKPFLEGKRAIMH